MTYVLYKCHKKRDKYFNEFCKKSLQSEFARRTFVTVEHERRGMEMKTYRIAYNGDRMEVEYVPHKGFRFYHSRVLSEDMKSQQLYEVSKVVQGMIYYRPVYNEVLGKGEKCEYNDFPRWIQRAA